MRSRRGIDRRSFLKMLGGGVVVLVSVGPSPLFSQDRRSIYPEDLNAYLRIGEDGQVTVFSGKIEMGQGVMTSLAQMVAEELGVALDSVTMILGDTDRCPWDRGTFGSMTTRIFGPALRAAAAEARAVLLRMAAKELGVGRGGLTAENGVVSVVGAPGRQITYGALAKGRRMARLVTEKAMLRSVAGFQVMGRSPRRIDGVEKVTGGARYAGDIRLPGMLYARLVRPPAHGAGLARLDTSEAEAMAGVSVVRQDDMVAVLAADPEAAAAGLHRIETDWQPASSQLDPETIFDHLVEKAPPSQVMVEQGDPATVGSRVGHLFETTYRKGYVAHAPMEPHTATASWEDGKLTVWASTQTPFPTRDHIARQLGLTSRDVRVITPFVGGGFGGKSAGRQALEAARLARATGRPVQVAWTRAEEFFFDTFDPAAVVKITSAMDGDGRLTLWDYEVYGAGDRATELFYRVPNARVRVHGGWHGEGSEVHPFAVGPWRAPGANMNVFARESQIDLMAAAAGRDPLDFRLRNTRDTRMRRVLRAAAEAFGWQAAPGPSGQGRAVACAADAGSYVALIAQVRVDRDQGSVQVDRVVCAQDMGVVVNPEGATMQVEGCITMGLGYVFAEELRFRGGEILDRNFGTYQLPRFSWVPKIETVLVKNEELAPQGGGEPAIVSMGAVMANAVFDATGARLLRLPLTPERVRDALRGVRPVGEPATVGAT